MIIDGDYDEQNWYGEVRINGLRLDLRPSQAVMNHSPDGFAWGYSGSGPSQLALAVLLRAGLSRERAVRLHHLFTRDFIAPLLRESFSIEVDVDKWIAEQEEKIGG